MIELGSMTQEESNTTYTELKMAMYGNVDAALLWIRTLTGFLIEKCGMKQSITDPSIYYMKDTEGQLKIVLSVHVDDLMVSGKQADVDDLKSKVKTKFGISDLGCVKKYLGMMYDWSEDEKGPYVKITMEKNATEIISKYEKHVGRSVKVAKIPGFSGKVLEKNSGDPVHMEIFRRFIEKLMYYSIKVGSDISNATR